MKAISKKLFKTKRNGRKVYSYQFSEGDLNMSSVNRTHVSKKDLKMLADLWPEFSAKKFRHGIRFAKKRVGRKTYRIVQLGNESANAAPYVAVDIKRKSYITTSCFRGYAEH